jgi:hypothetical protein
MSTKVKTKKILAELEGEFSTEEVFQAGASFFKATRNGGERGAHQVNNKCPDYLDAPVQITRDEALAEAARLGCDEVEIDD